MDQTLFDLFGELKIRGYSEEEISTEEVWYDRIIPIEYENEVFSNLERMPVFYWLEKNYNILSKNYNIRLLTYLGWHNKIHNVLTQKEINVSRYKWMKNIPLLSVVKSKYNKKYYADKDSILIDDDFLTCYAFQKQSGDFIHVDRNENTSANFTNSFLELQLNNLLR